MRLTLHNILTEIKSRKLRKALAVYIGVAIPLIGVANLLENRYSIPHIWFDRLLVLLSFGLLFTLVAAWYHGREKIQKFRPRELVIYATFLMAAAGAVVLLPEGGGLPRPARPEMDKSIAVLPFQNFSDEKSDEFFSDGVTEDILTQLSKVADLRVISRTTMRQYKGTAKSIRTIGEELRVATVLEGSVRRDGNRVRIVGQLIDARTDEHLWADSYDREMRDIFLIQSDVAQHIARALAAVLSPQEKRRITIMPTDNVDAYALFLQGRHHYAYYTNDGNETAIGFFRQAIELDPTYALAYAGLSDAYSQRVQRYGYGLEWLDSAGAAARTAIGFDPECADGYKALGLVYDNRGFIDLALEQYEKAVALNPNLAVAIRNIGLIYYRTGQLDRSLELAMKSVALSPDNVIGYVQVGMVLQSLVEDSAAESWYRRGRRLDPENPFPLLGMGDFYYLRGDIGRAGKAVDTLLSIAPSLPPGLDLLASLKIQTGDYRSALAAYERSGSGPRGEGGFILLKLGRRNEALEVAEETVERCRRAIERGDRGPTPRVEMALAFAVLGKGDSVSVWLRNAVDAGWRDYRRALRDPLLAEFGSEEWFVLLLSRMKSDVDRMRALAARASSPVAE